MSISPVMYSKLPMNWIISDVEERVTIKCMHTVG